MSAVEPTAENVTTDDVDKAVQLFEALAHILHRFDVEAPLVSQPWYGELSTLLDMVEARFRDQFCGECEECKEGMWCQEVLCPDNFISLAHVERERREEPAK